MIIDRELVLCMRESISYKRYESKAAHGMREYKQFHACVNVGGQKTLNI